jgi:hypothetical protein
MISGVALGLVTLACNSDGRSGGARPSDGTGGSSGAGGSGGSGATGGTAGSGGSGGSVSPDASPGGMGGGGSGGGGSGGGTPDAPMAADSSPSDGGSSDADPGGVPYPTKPEVRICPKDWNQTQCCAFLCSCLTNLCSDSPMDKARIPGCMSMCMGLSDARARCQVYHCYESKSRSGIGDHASHCGHASGRVGGGGCPAAIYQ